MLRSLKNRPESRDIITNLLGLAIAVVGVAGQQGMIEGDLASLIAAILSACVAYFVK